MIMDSSLTLLESDQENFLEKLGIFKIQGRDKVGRKVLLITGKLFPARVVSSEVLKKYLEEKIYPKLEEKPFSVVYMHTDVQRSENFPGISALRSIYEDIPINVKNHLECVHFLHPDLQARLFLATFGRFLFSGGLYSKLKYVTRLEFLWDHVRRSEIEIPEFVYDHDEELEFLWDHVRRSEIEMPEFVYDHDEELEYRPMMDYGLESDHPGVYGGPSMDNNPLSVYSLRGIA